MPVGPMVAVNTTVEAVNLDVSRTLGLGASTKMYLIVPDTTQEDNWRTVKIITSGFDRVTLDEVTLGDARSIFYRIADKKGNLGPILRMKDLHVKVLGEIHSVSKTDSPAPNEAQVYTLTCKTRTLRNKHFDK